MKTKLLILTCLLVSSVTMSQIVANQVDDFQDATTQNWRIGNPSGADFPPVNVADAGPAGAGDNCLEYSSTGVNGDPGSKMIIFNTNEQWSGDFTAAGVVGVRFDVRVLTTALNLRIAIQGSGTRICTTNSVAVNADGVWTTVIIPISASDFTLVNGGATIPVALSNVFSMRILSSDAPTWDSPDEVDSTIQLDNITALTTLSVDEFNNADTFSISPNPASSKMNVYLPNTVENASITIFDVLGKRVYNRDLTALTSSIDVSNWNSGVYLVRVSSDNGTHTKRFVKQ